MRNTSFRLPEALTPEAEAAFYRSLTPEQRSELLLAVCRGAAALLRAREDAERASSFVDPLPESTLRALARLRAMARGGPGGPASTG